MSNTRRPTLNNLLAGIQEGKYDKNLSEIIFAVGKRREAIADEVIDFVKSSLGDDWEVTRSNTKRVTSIVQLDQTGEEIGVIETNEEVLRAPRLSLEEDPLSEEDESRSPIFGSIGDELEVSDEDIT